MCLDGLSLLSYLETGFVGKKKHAHETELVRKVQQLAQSHLVGEEFKVGFG